MNIKINSARSAAVNQDTFWLPIDEVPPPVGVKLLLINERNGVAVLGTYLEKHQWSHWQGLPKFKQPGEADAGITVSEPSRTEPIAHGPWIYEFTRDLFVVFDPMTDGAHIAGAVRTLAEAEAILEKLGRDEPSGPKGLVGWVTLDGRLVWANRNDAIGRNLYTRPEPTREDVLLEVIQRLNQNPYSLTKSECIDLISAMRDEATRGAA